MKTQRFRTDNAGGAIANLVVLALGELHQEFGNLVLNLHLVQNGGAVVGDGDFTIGRNQNLIEAFGAKRRLDNLCNGFAGQNVRLCSVSGERERDGKRHRERERAGGRTF